jgi:hypothetical protein
MAELPEPASPIIQAELSAAPALSNLTTVEDLSDVHPTDWAFQALQLLVERYGCLSGYPDHTFRGNRAMTRYEFASALNQCLTAVIAVHEQLAPIELETLQRLQAEFQAELTTLTQQVTDLEQRTAELEAQQFSTTTRLRGEAVFSLVQPSGGSRPNSNTGSLPENLSFGSSLRLNFDTSFSGEDLLRVRLDALNPVALNAQTTGTNMTRLNFDRSNQNSVDVGQLFYRFPVGDRLQIQVDAVKGSYYGNTLNTFNPSLASPITGAVSRFGRFNPIYYQGFPGSGVTATYDLVDSLALSLGYMAQDRNAADAQIGLFGGGYTALAQAEYHPSKDLIVGLTYAHAYYPPNGVAVSGGTGSRLANAPFGNIATSADQFGLESSLRLGPGATLSGWAGLTLAQAEANGGSAVRGDDATLVNWALTLGLPDLGGRGNFGGLIVGQPPRVTNNTGGLAEGSSAWHVEGLYRYQVNPHLSLIPGLFVVFNPEHQSSNDPIWVFSLRTAFQF